MIFIEDLVLVFAQLERVQGVLVLEGDDVVQGRLAELLVAFELDLPDDRFLFDDEGEQDLVSEPAALRNCSGTGFVQQVDVGGDALEVAQAEQGWMSRSRSGRS